MNNIAWKFIALMAFALLWILPIAFAGGLVLDNLLFPSPTTAAYGWLLFLLPFNVIGGIIIGTVEGLIFSLLYQNYSAKQAWLVLTPLICLVAVANSYLVLLPGLLTLILNFGALYWLQCYCLPRSR